MTGQPSWKESTFRSAGQTYSLRPATRQDIDRLHELDELCFPAGRAFSTGYFFLLFLYHRAFGWILEQLPVDPADSPGSGSRQLAAFILLTEKRRIANISTIDVHPLHRRRGLASYLLRVAEQALRQWGCLGMTLQVAVDNEGAQKLYARFGFKQSRILRRYYGGRIDALLLEKSL